MKKTLILILAILVLAVGIFLIACDELTPPNNDGSGNDTEQGGSSSGGGGNENQGGGSSASAGNQNQGTTPAKESEGLEFTLINNDTEYEVSGIGTCTDTDLVIPSTYDNKPVTSIGYKAFYKCTGLTSITIPNSVASIGYSAFYECTGLKSVTIGDSVTNIGERAFDGCYNLVEVANKSSLTITKGSSGNGYVGYYALEVHTGESKIVNKDGYLFYTYNGVNYLLGYSGTDTALTLPSDYNGQTYEIYECAFFCNDKITKVVISDKVTNIGERAFCRCDGLTSITIPDSVTSIDYQAFYGCTGLTSVNYLGDIAKWCAIDFYYYYSNPLACAGNLYLNGTLVTALVIPEGVTSIGEYAFYGCTGLTSVTIPNSVTSIGYHAFSGCDVLTSVTIGNGVTSIGDSAFENCTGLKEINFNATNCNDLSSTNHVFTRAGYNGNGITVTFGENVKYIPENLFCSTSYHPRIKKVILGNNVTSIGDSAFRGCKIAYIIIPNSVRSIGALAFADCILLNAITIGNGVTSIGESAFWKCTGLKSVTIGDSVTNIGERAFDGCYNLVEVANKSSLTITKGSSGNGYVGYYALEVHTGESKIVNKDGYLFYTYNGVNYLLGYIGIDTALTLPSDYNGQSYEIYKYAFSNNDKITSVVIPDKVTNIGNYAFYECTGLTSIKYRGSTGQWDAISKGSHWDESYYHHYSNEYYYRIDYTITYNYDGE